MLRTAFLATLLVAIEGSDAQERPDSWQPCRIRFQRLRDLGNLHPPQRILLVPLLRKAPEQRSGERWPEIHAARIEAFYRRQFRADVVWLRDVRLWQDFYRKIQPLQQQSRVFDRIVFIGHGGFDGPILNAGLLREGLSVSNGQASIYRDVEYQPGLLRAFSIAYDVDRDPAFSQYAASNWRELAQMDPPVASKQLRAVERQLQGLDQACFQRHCSPALLAASRNEAEREAQLTACESVCRNPLFMMKWGDEVAPVRFKLFVDSLRSLTQENGLIFFGQCNPGTVAVRGKSSWDREGVLVHSSLANGPHDTYLQLMAAATARAVAGPVGNSSGEDMVRRIRLLEIDHPQSYLCIVDPRAN